MITIYDEDYLANKLGISRRDFHRSIKPFIIRDFKKELHEGAIHNPNIGLDKEGFIYLVDPRDKTIYLETKLSIYSSPHS
jgi:hypothetical protein